MADKRSVMSNLMGDLSQNQKARDLDAVNLAQIQNSIHNSLRDCSTPQENLQNAGSGMVPATNSSLDYTVQNFGVAPKYQSINQNNHIFAKKGKISVGLNNQDISTFLKESLQSVDASALNMQQN